MLKSFIAAFSVQVLLAVLTHGLYFSRREKITDTGTHILICEQEPIELSLVLDSSSSISHKDFQEGIRFLQEFVDHFDVGNGAEGVRVSIITYGRGIYPEDGFNLTTYSTKEEVIDAIGRIPHRVGLYTDTGKAIRYMHEVQQAPGVVRPWAQKICIVVTDGNSQEWRVTKSEAEKARADNITMFAVGVGRGVRDEELLNIAGNISRVTKVESYSQLSAIKETLASHACTATEKTTPPPPPKSSCGELHPADIYFVFNPANLGPDATGWTTSFISQTISSEDLDVGFRYGVISGSCPDDEGFDLDDFSTVEEYQERLSGYSSNIGRLVERLIDGAYSPERGGRVEANNVAVLVASGNPEEVEDLEEYVRRLTDSGITVFIADPSGSDLSIQGAVTLDGRSARQQSEALVSFLCPE